MKAKLLYTLLLLLFSQSSMAQKYVTGRLIDDKVGEALRYVSIGVHGKASGTLSDTLGDFRLKYSQDVTDSDSITFALMGYETLKLRVGDYNGGDVLLESRAIPMEAVVITPGKRKEANLGQNSAGIGGVYFTFFTSTDSSRREAPEGGTILKPKHDCTVNRLNFKIAENRYKKARLRLSFYSVKDKSPNEIIVDKEIIFDLENNYTGWYYLDLKPYEIALEAQKEVAVTLTLLENEMNEDRQWIALHGVLDPFSKTVKRSKAMDNWELITYGAIVLSLDVTYHIERLVDTPQRI